MMMLFTKQKELDLQNLALQLPSSYLIVFIAQKDNLRNMSNSVDWTHSKCGKGGMEKKSAAYMVPFLFWNNVIFALTIRVLRLVDGETNLPCDYMCEAMYRIKEAKVRSFNENEERCKEVF